MKSITEIRESLKNKEQESKQQRLVELLSWVEQCISHHAFSKGVALSFHPKELLGLEEEFKIEAEKAGYKVESKEYTWESGFLKKEKYTERKVHVSWESEDV